MFKTINYIAITFVLVFTATQIFATPVGPMSYQGRLLDNNGVPINGSFNFVVRIYDDLTTGTLKYQEAHNGVSVTDGVYSFKIGTEVKTGGDSEWDINLWQSNLNDLFLEIEINGETLSPRSELTSAPHAFTSTFALSADSLGNKTAAEFDNILEGVCVSGSGKWLDKINKCLGTGASVTNETLSSMMETPDTDFQNLNLVSADLTGTQFDTADFSGSTFDNTTVAADGLENTNLTGIVMNNVTFTGVAQTGTTINLTDAKFKNMDMSLWDLSNATLTGFSAANITACPTLPASWSCVAQDDPAAGRYVLLGPGVNLSASSAVKVDTFGANTLDVHRTIFNSLNLTGANFQGISFNKQTFDNANLTGADFSFVKIQRVLFITTDLTNANFSHATFNWVLFDSNTAVDGADFGEASIRIGAFQADANNVDFSFSTLEEMDFSNINSADFTDLLAKDVKFDGDISGDVYFHNALFVGNEGNQPTEFEGTITGNVYFTGNVSSGDGFKFINPVPSTVVFDGGEYTHLSGDFGGVTFSNLRLRHGFTHSGPLNEVGPTFNNVTVDNVNFHMAELRYTTFTGTCTLENNAFTNFDSTNLIGTDFGNCVIPSSANWMLATCPDGTLMDFGHPTQDCQDDGLGGDYMTPAAGP